MNTFRTIEQIINPPDFHWVGNGFKVNNFLPQGIHSNARMSPFFLLDYNAKMYYAPSNEKRGVGVHPHRGLETVTIAYKGSVAHHDSVGNSGVIHEGDVQWMTAGKGILHKEYHDENYVKQGGDFQMVQLWVNLPAEHKMTTPKYQSIPNSIIGEYKIKNNGGVVHVIAGEYQSVKGAAATFTPINLLDVKLQKGVAIDFNFKTNHNTAILILDGSVKVNNDKIATCNQLVLFNNDGSAFELQAIENATILVMSGEPIDEPIYPYGPFLMNTKEEIVKAYDDYENGVFGYLED